MIAIIKKPISILLSVLIILLTVSGVTAVSADNKKPDFDINTEAMYLIDEQNGDVLYSNNENDKRPIASLTQIMTYIVAADKISSLNKTMIEINQKPLEAVDEKAPIVGFKDHIGEKFSALDIMYGMLLVSGCDAAHIIADYVCNGDTDKFVDMMNEKAEKLGCENTHFNNVDGFSDDNNYSTAKDLYSITKYAKTLSYFNQVVNTESYTLANESEPLINSNYMIDKVNGGKYYYQYANGIDSGYTALAGDCLVSSASKGNTSLMCIALGGKNTDEDDKDNHAMIDSKNLFEWAFKNFSDNIEISLDKRFKSIQLGESAKLSAKVGDNNTKSKPAVEWSSSDDSIATVDQNGVVTAHSLGQADITAKTQTGNFDVCTVSCGFYSGIDVTLNTGDYSTGEKAPLDWKVLKNIGIDFAIIRADADSDGDSSQNYEKFAKDVKGAVENDIPYGISFVSNAKNANDAKEEAEYLVKKLKEYIPNYLDKMSLAIAYDMTDVRFKDYSTDDNTSIALAFNEVMSKNGYSVSCCSNKEVFGKINIDKLLKADVKLLYSYYPHKADLSKEIKINDNYTPDIWQYRNNGYIPQASDNYCTRQNLYYMLSSQIDKYSPITLSAKLSDDNKKANLNWNEPSYDVDGFEIYRFAPGDNEFVKIADVSSDTYSYEDNSLKLNGTYKYYVSAKLSDKLDDSYTQTLASNVVELSVKTGEQETGTTGLDYTIPTCLANNVAAKSTVLNPNQQNGNGSGSSATIFTNPDGSINTGTTSYFVIGFIIIAAVAFVVFYRLKGKSAKQDAKHLK
mgnify:FL=1